MPEKRYLRYRCHGEPAAHWGEWDGTQVIELSAAPWMRESAPSGRRHERNALELLPPAEPTKIVALGYNYRDLFEDRAAMARSTEKHFSDPGFEPMLFLKGPNALAAHDGAIEIPGNAAEVWIEVELAIVIGERIGPRSDAADIERAVFGFTIGNDVSALNIEGRDWHLARSKSRDGFCPLGPELVHGFDDRDRSLSASINGRVTQSSSTSERVLDTVAALRFIAGIMTLEPGDVVLTGTPRGARQSIVAAGDVVEVTVAGLGVLRNRFEGAK